MAVNAAPAGRRDQKLAMSISMAAVLTVAGVWAYAHFSADSTDTERPKPVWLGVTSAMPQLSDGHMLQVQVSLRLKDQDSVTEVRAHEPALKALVIDVAQDMSSHDLVGTKGMKRYGKAIKTAMNEYLSEQHLSQRVGQVAFEDLMILP